MMGFRDFCVWFSGEGTALRPLDLQTVAMWELHWVWVWWDFGLEVYLCFFPPSLFSFFLKKIFLFFHEGQVAPAFPPLFLCFVFLICSQGRAAFPAILLLLQSCLHISLSQLSSTSVNFCIWCSLSAVECLILVHLKKPLLTNQSLKNSSTDT